MRSEWTVSGKEAVIRVKHSMEIGDEFYAYIIDWSDVETLMNTIYKFVK